jgi:glutaredoxin
MIAMSLRDWFRSGRELDAIELALYTRANCPLCDEMKREIAHALGDEPHVLREIDIDSDPALAELHGRSVPVLAIDGRVAFKGRLSARDLVRKVERARREKRRA